MLAFNIIRYVVKYAEMDQSKTFRVLWGWRMGTSLTIAASLAWLKVSLLADADCSGGLGSLGYSY